MADINIRIGAKLDGLQRSIKKAQSQLTRFSDFAERVGTDLTTRLSLPIVGVGTAAVTSFAKFEKLELGLRALADEGENAGETLARLQKIAQLPGINLDQAVNASNQLRVVGFEAAQAEAILVGLSKAVTLDSKGPEQLGAVVKQLVQMSAKGRILQEDLGVIQENVPSIGLAIEDAFGTQNIEAIRATGVSAQQFTAEIIKAISVNEKFQKAQGGLSNEFDNFSQSVQFSLAALGRTIAESINLSGILQSLSGFLQRVTKRFQELSPGVKKFIVIAAGVAAAIGPVVLGFGAIIKVGVSVVASIKLIGGALAVLAANPIGIAVAAIVGLVLAFRKAFTSSDKFRATILGIGAVIKKFAIDAVRFLRLPFDIIDDLFSGNIEKAAERALNIFKDNGKNAGEVFAEAYSASIAKSAAGNFGTQGRLGGSRGEAPTQDLDSVFSNIPSGSVGAVQVAADTELAKESFSAFSDQAAQIVTDLTNITAAAERGGTSLREMAATSGLQNELTKSITDLGLSIQTAPTFLSEAALSMQDYQSQIDLAVSKNNVFGSSFQLLGQKIQITRSALDAAIEKFGENSDVVQGLTEKLFAYNDQMEQINAQQERFNAVAAGIQQVGEAFGEILSSGAVSFKKFARAALDAIGAVIGALIKQGVAGAVSNALKDSVLFGPAAIGIAAASGAAASALFRGLLNAISAPKLAGGGLAFGPTLAVVGDNLGASSDPEVIAPLSKLKDYIDGAGGGQIRGIIRGADLLLMLERAQYNDGRISGA